MTQIDFNKINELAESYKPDMTRFLRDMIKLPSESCQEKAVVHADQGRDGEGGF